MRQNKTSRVSKRRIDKIEDILIEQVDLSIQCKDAIGSLRSIIRHPDFCTSLSLQKDAAKVIRGMAVKMRSVRVIEASESDDTESLLKQVMEISREYEGLFREQLINMKHSMNLEEILAGLPREFADRVRSALIDQISRDPGGTTGPQSQSV